MTITVTYAAAAVAGLAIIASSHLFTHSGLLRNLAAAVGFAIVAAAIIHAIAP